MLKDHICAHHMQLQDHDEPSARIGRAHFPLESMRSHSALTAWSASDRTAAFTSHARVTMHSTNAANQRRGVPDPMLVSAAVPIVVV